MCRVFRIVALVIAVGVCAAPAAASGPNVLYNFLSNQCLQPINGSTSQGAAIVQEPCNDSPAQSWTVVSVGNNIFHYVNVLSGLCLDARGKAVNGTPIQRGPATASAMRTGNLGKTTAMTTFHRCSRGSPALAVTVSTYQAGRIRTGWRCRSIAATGLRRSNGLSMYYYL